MRWLIIFLLLAGSGYGQWFSSFFNDSTLRIDVYHSGTRETERIDVEQYYVTPTWAGNPDALLDTLNRGHYFLRVLDVKTQQLIYSYGFSTLFNEWQTTDEAQNGGRRTFPETIRIPFPRRPVQIEWLVRDEQNRFTRSIATWVFDPGAEWVNTENRAGEVMVRKILDHGNPHHHVDVVIVGDGYTAAEAEAFFQRAAALVDTLFSIEPYRHLKSAFNVTAVLRPSLESGTDNPREGVYRNTALGTSFNTFGLQRYLMITNTRTVQDVASAVPWDALIILVNTDIYGGGGIYNLYACTAANNRFTPYVFVHEFGHSFAGLGDEYYTSTVAYNEFYPRGVEPWEPNITALLHPPRVKWQQFVTPGIPIPTPWDKATYDRMVEEYQKTMQKLRESGAGAAKIADVQRRYRKKMQHFFQRHPYRGKIGAFEGAGYASRGLYRPALDCIMFSRTTAGFDAVCGNAIQQVIYHYSK